MKQSVCPIVLHAKVFLRRYTIEVLLFLDHFFKVIDKFCNLVVFTFVDSYSYVKSVKFFCIFSYASLPYLHL